jgi:protein-tyrosine-phosphatase
MDTPQVVFVCRHGAAKSVIAATTFDRLARARGLAIRATFAGARDVIASRVERLVARLAAEP